MGVLVNRWQMQRRPGEQETKEKNSIIRYEPVAGGRGEESRQWPRRNGADAACRRRESNRVPRCCFLVTFPFCPLCKWLMVRVQITVRHVQITGPKEAGTPQRSTYFTTLQNHRGRNSPKLDFIWKLVQKIHQKHDLDTDWQRILWPKYRQKWIWLNLKKMHN